MAVVQAGLSDTCLTLLTQEKSVVAFSRAGFFDFVLASVHLPKLAVVQLLPSFTIGMLRPVAPGFQANSVDAPLVRSDDVGHDANLVWSNAVVLRHLLIRSLFATGRSFPFDFRTVERAVDVALPGHLIHIINARRQSLASPSTSTCNVRGLPGAGRLDTADLLETGSSQQVIGFSQLGGA